MQERRSINLPTEIHEELSILQAKVRLHMKQEKVEYLLSKTAMTNILKAIIKASSPEEVANMLK